MVRAPPRSKKKYWRKSGRLWVSQVVIGVEAYQRIRPKCTCREAVACLVKGILPPEHRWEISDIGDLQVYSDQLVDWGYPTLLVDLCRQSGRCKGKTGLGSGRGCDVGQLTSSLIQAGRSPPADDLNVCPTSTGSQLVEVGLKS